MMEGIAIILGLVALGYIGYMRSERRKWRSQLLLTVSLVFA